MRLFACSLLLWLLYAPALQGQPPDINIFNRYVVKATRLQNDFIGQSQRSLNKIYRLERLLKKQIDRRLPNDSRLRLQDTELDISSLRVDLMDTAKVINPLRQEYIPLLDSVQVALKYHQQFLLQNTDVEQVKRWSSSLDHLQGSVTRATNLETMYRQYIANLEQKLGSLNKLRAFRKLKTKIGQYQLRIAHLKSLTKEPDKLLAEAINQLRGQRVFQTFFRQHSLLAVLLPPSNDDLGPDMISSTNGLQSRFAVRQFIAARTGGGTNSANAMQIVRQQAGQAQAQISAIKSRLQSLQSREMPPEITGKPNLEAKNTFWNRIQIGTNVQNSRRGTFTPTATDLGLSLGYKLNPRSIVGIGGSYRLGWGRDIGRIAFSNEGIGIRSFLDWKIKGNLYGSGGYELNYQPIDGINGTPPPAAWTPSGLMGVSKMISTSKRFLKQAKLQLLIDLLANQQVPKTPLLKFRLGYNFK